MRTVPLVLAGVVGGLMVLGIVTSASTPKKPAPVAPPPAPVVATPPKPQQPPLIGTAMMAVKKFMHNPDAASFPPSNEWTAATLGPGRWQVQGEVSGMNGFNARVRQPVIVEMHEDGENMRVTFVRIGNQTVYGKQ